jgi:tetratricopeptide (TPR) repeat protein
VLNNLAICYEAAGRFEEALATYREALAIEPGNRSLKSNYSRFAEFYQDFRLAPAAPKAAEAPAEAPAEPPAGEGPADAPAGAPEAAGGGAR